jgi:hypothetical protein
MIGATLMWNDFIMHINHPEAELAVQVLTASP